MAVTIEDVENLDSRGWTQLSNDKKQYLLEQAEREANTLYSGRLSTVSEIEGALEDFISNLSAHKWEQAEGGEAQSESSQGGSVNYNTVSGEPLNDLASTRYGRTCLRYLRQGASISVVRSN